MCIRDRSLHELVNDGLQNKLLHIPQEARTRLQETLERVINEGCTGPVSYTHLDVYKRQTFCGAGRGAVEHLTRKERLTK